MFLLFLSTAIFAQNAKVPVDTLFTSDKFVNVVIYSDKTWDSISLPKPKYMDALVYDEFWDTEKHGAYKELELTDIPDTVIIKLVEDSTEFCIPKVGYVYSRYGIRHGRAHSGVDIPLNIGDSVRATFEGKVRYTDYYAGYGNMIVIRHPNGLETYYAHLSKILVKEGDFVNVGELIGFGGSTGRSTGPHLHFEVRYKGFPFDPERMIDWKESKLRSDTLLVKRNFLSPYSRYGSTTSSSAGSYGVSGATVTPDGETWHTIRQGDTLSAIAKRYGTTVNRICSLNRNLTPETILQLGRKIRVN